MTEHDCQILKYASGKWSNVLPMQLGYSVRIIGALAAVVIKMKIANDLKMPVRVTFKCNLPEQSWVNFFEAETGAGKVRVYKEYSQGKFRYSSAESNGNTLMFLKDPIKRMINIQFSHLGARQTGLFTLNLFQSLTPLSKSKWILNITSFFAGKSQLWKLRVRTGWPTSGLSLSSNTHPNMSSISSSPNSPRYELKSQGTQNVSIEIEEEKESDLLITTALSGAQEKIGGLPRLATLIVYKHPFMQEYAGEGGKSNWTSDLARVAEEDYQPVEVVFLLDSSSDIDHSLFILNMFIDSLSSTVHINVGISSGEGSTIFYETSQLVESSRKDIKSRINKLTQAAIYDVDAGLSSLMDKLMEKPSSNQLNVRRRFVIISKYWRVCNYYGLDSMKKLVKHGITLFRIDTALKDTTGKLFTDVVSTSGGKEIYLGEDLNIHDYHSEISQLVHDYLSPSSDMLVNFKTTYNKSEILFTIPSLSNLSRIHPSRPITIIAFLNHSLLDQPTSRGLRLSLAFSRSISNEHTNRSIDISIDAVVNDSIVHQSAVDRYFESTIDVDRRDKVMTDGYESYCDQQHADDFAAFGLTDYRHSELN